MGVLKVDLMYVFVEFHYWGELERASMLPSLLLSLKSIGNGNQGFSLISPVGDVYKIISRVLVNKMNITLERSHLELKNAYIRVRLRQILYPVLIVNECLDYILHLA